MYKEQTDIKNRLSQYNQFQLLLQNVQHFQVPCLILSPVPFAQARPPENQGMSFSSDTLAAPRTVVTAG